MRQIVAAVLFAIAGAMIVLAALSLANLGDRHQDGPDSQFIIVAAAVLVIALISTAAGFWTVRNRRS